ncbi:uncharacterized protein LOC114541418, partial [Dendronephthya gigantea]|uniref:uncharacterized protein LOC114541418 n=1 Tax=Dendronephthya gigantea TaxID=151771 RepID=UPI00106B2A55
QGWLAGKAVGYCINCNIFGQEYEEKLENNKKSEQTNAGDSSTIPQNEDDGEENCTRFIGTKRKKGKAGRKAVWSTDAVDDLVDIITSDDYNKQKLIFTNTKNQNNGIIYEKVLTELKKRANARGEEITFTVQQLRTKFKRCVSDCKQAAMKIKTATGIQRFQDEKGFGKWFDLLFPLVKTRDSCQPGMAVEPSALNDLSEEEEIAKTFDDFVPQKKIKLPKKNQVTEAVELLKQIVEKDPAKELITFMQEEADKARKHELQLVELMLKHTSTPTNSNQVNLVPPHDISGMSFGSVHGGPHQNWSSPQQYFSNQSTESPMYNMPTIGQPSSFVYHPGNGFSPPSVTK